jgi:hypothetical protein
LSKFDGKLKAATLYGQLRSPKPSMHDIFLSKEIGYNINVVSEMVECHIKYFNHLSTSAADYYYYYGVTNNTQHMITIRFQLKGVTKCCN